MTMLKLFLLFAIVTFLSCNLSKIDGMLGVSKDVGNSKNRNVFIKEFPVHKERYIINDTLSLSVKSAWLEHQWRYTSGNGNKSKKEKEGYQLVLISDENSLKGYGDNWMIGLTGKNSFRLASRNALIINIDTIPAENSLNWDVQDSNQLSSKIKKNIIGKFSLTGK